MLVEALFVAVLGFADPQTTAGADPSAPPASEAPKVVAGVVLHPVEENLIERTNAERVRHGLPPLKLDPQLMDTARRHASWMTRSHNLQHTHLPVAENIAMGQNSSAEAVHSWMNSSGHRANILSGRYTRIGVAAYTSTNGTCFWCQQFR